MASTPQEIVEGARVYSMSEPELGIGVVVRIEEGQALLQFPNAKISRRYSLKSAPIKRAILSAGQKVKLKNGEVHTVGQIEFEKGLAKYFINKNWVWEFELSTEQVDMGSIEQFLSGQWTHPEAFDLRKEAWRLKAKASDPTTRGITGARAELLPHQLYIASRVVSRINPRVLLADEVGLGKTIEAGLILSSLHRLGRATRILIVVPEALKTQWLAELYRRFHILFSILDEARCLEEEKTNHSLTPYESSSLVICTLEHFMKHENRLQQATDAKWDLLIIDEAHHLMWNPSDPSPAWIAAKKLAEATQSLLLLTATPRQHGLDTQFGLLNLVDPDRFSNFEKFCDEATHLGTLSDLARTLSQNPESVDIEKLKKLFPKDTELLSDIQSYQQSKNSSRLLSSLIDRHGPGRVLFRNRRARLKGFPQRSLTHEKLSGDLKFGETFCDFSRAHPKLKWVEDFLLAHPNEKILFITSTAAQVRHIDQYLADRVPIKKALFHDEMEMLERDRQAAWFSEPKGANILIASEIGGEGRNFQFCKKIVLLNLPPEPDLVEQRIGRLDRIGQKNNIEVIVPIIENSVEDLYFQIFNQGLDLFTQASAGLGALVEPFQKAIDDLCEKIRLEQKGFSVATNSAPLIKKLKTKVTEYRNEQEKNFDFLVDLNSFHEKKGNELREKMDSIDKDYSLEDYMTRVFEFFGIEEEDLSQNIKKAVAHSLMYVESFPELTDELSFTYSRSTALFREEISFLTQDHPMVSGVFSLILEKDLGRSSIGFAAFDSIRNGALFEFSFVLNPPTVQGLVLEHFLRPISFTLLADHTGKFVDSSLINETIVHKLSDEEEASLRSSLGKLRQVLPQILKAAQEKIEPKTMDIKHSAIKQAEDFFKLELERMEYLHRINQSVSLNEINAFNKSREQTLAALEQATLHLDGVRMILVRGENS